MAHGARPENGVSTRAWWLFLALGLIWGIPYLLIRIAVVDLPPVCVRGGCSLTPKHASTARLPGS